MNSDIVSDFHKALCGALGVDFKLGFSDRSRWQRFIFEINQSLDEDPLEPQDVWRVVLFMRRQNEKREAKWALRYGKILMDPETFRDLVIENRKVPRKRGPSTVIAEQKSGDITRQVEVPSEQEEKRIRDLAKSAFAELKHQLRPR